MGYLYKWTFSYYAKGPRGTPYYESEYYYNVHVRRRMSRKRYKRIEQSLRARARRHFRRYSKRARERYGAKVRGELRERTALEKPVGSRAKKEKVTSKAIRMRVKEGKARGVDMYKPGREAKEEKTGEGLKAFRKRITQKEVAMPRTRRRKKK